MTIPVTNCLAAIYIVGVVLGSLASDAWKIPCFSIFCDKFNILNQYFVKLCWGWSLFLCLTLFTIKLWRQLIDNQKYCVVWLHFVAGTVIWFTGTQSVDYIKDSYGTCETGANVTTESNKVKCRNEMNGQWVPDLDISGHIFMMVFCCLLIAYEEERFYRPEHFIKTVEIVSPAETLSSDNEDDEPVKKWTENQEKCVLPDVLLQFMDRFVTSIVFVIFSVFNLMMIMTTLYFHTPIEKVLGVAMGVCGYVLISFKYPWLCFPQNCKTISRKK